MPNFCDTTVLLGKDNIKCYSLLMFLLPVHLSVLLQLKEKYINSILYLAPSANSDLKFKMLQIWLFIHTVIN